MPRPRKGRQSTRNLDTVIKVGSLLLAFGAPLVSLISMLSSYKEQAMQTSKEVAHIAQQLQEIEKYSNAHEINLDVFKQNITDSVVSLDRLQRDLDSYNEKILDLYKQTSSNTAQIQQLQTQLQALQLEQNRRR